MKILKYVLTVILGILIISGSALLTVANGNLNQIQAKDGSDQEIVLNADHVCVNDKIEEPVTYTNIALFGVDSRNGKLGKGTRSDSIMIASINNKTREIRIISIYRDTFLDIGNGKMQKCNAAYAFGGATQAVNMLNKNLDLDIKNYITVDFSCLAELIDSLGGIEIEVSDEEANAMNRYIKETSKIVKKDSKCLNGGGHYTLDGVQGVAYARIRKLEGGDFNRAARQREVLKNITEKLKQTDLLKITSLINEFLPYVKTNLSKEEMIKYAAKYADLKITGMEGFPFEKTTDTIRGYGSLVIPVSLEENVQKLHKFLFQQEQYDVTEPVKQISSEIIAKTGMS